LSRSSKRLRFLEKKSEKTLQLDACYNGSTEGLRASSLLGLEDLSLVFFTDGSRIKESSGAAYWENQNTQALIPLSRHNTVFESEIMAIVELASLLTDNVNQVIHIFVDSMSVLNSLQTGCKTSSLVKECFQKLSRLSSANSVTLHGIPALSGLDGNECVDK
jgi:predicted AAA+ superfamily ATPase